MRINRRVHFGAYVFELILQLHLCVLAGPNNATFAVKTAGVTRLRPQNKREVYLYMSCNIGRNRCYACVLGGYSRPRARGKKE